MKEKYKKYYNYKTLIALLAAGAILMLSGGGTGESRTTEEKKHIPPYEEELCRALEGIEGAGKIQLYISYRNYGREINVYDVQSSSDGDDKSISMNVTTEGGKPYASGMKAPEIKGVLVVSSGADSDAVRKRLKDSVRAATGVPPGRIHIEKGSE